MYKRVDMYNEPRAILDEMKDSYCEMHPNEHGVLCGLIRKFLPKKIVEVGVAGGGTTAVIMKCLDLLDNDAKMFSVDLSKMCYRKKDKTSGYQLEEVRDSLSNYSNHTFLLGKILPYVIENIGGEIDFVVLDTLHSLPGELLDFLCILPFLKDGAIVVLHDTILNLGGQNKEAYATKIVLDVSTGEKYFDYENWTINIGAIRIGEDTRKNIANVFSALSISWRYCPSESDLLAYRNIYKKYYDEECLKLFDIFVEYQSNLFRK